ncbi:MAG TPA: hypothetical protein VGH90_05180 [Chthoniobacteraceae bacterium]
MKHPLLLLLTAVLCLGTFDSAQAKGAARHPQHRHQHHRRVVAVHVIRHHRRGWHVAWFGRGGYWWAWDGVVPNPKPPRLYTKSETDPTAPKARLDPPSSSAQPAPLITTPAGS